MGVVEGGRRQRPVETRAFPVVLTAVSDPEADEHQDAHADQEADEALTDRADPAEADPAGVVRVLEHAGHVGGDVPGLGVGDVAGAEVGHVARARADGLDHLGRGGQVEARGVRAVRQRVTGARDGVAGGAVEGEQGVARFEVGARAVWTSGTWVPSPGVSDCTQAAISRVWRRSKRGGLRVAWALGLARGIRPVETQKSTVPAPRPWRLGATPVSPLASVPWQLAQLACEQGLAGGDEGGGQVGVDDAGLVGRGGVVAAAEATRHGGDRCRSGGGGSGRRRRLGGGRRAATARAAPGREDEQADQGDAARRPPVPRAGLQARPSGAAGRGPGMLQRLAFLDGSASLEEEEAAVEADPHHVDEVPVVADALEDRRSRPGHRRDP